MTHRVEELKLCPVGTWGGSAVALARAAALAGVSVCRAAQQGALDSPMQHC